MCFFMGKIIVMVYVILKLYFCFTINRLSNNIKKVYYNELVNNYFSSLHTFCLKHNVNMEISDL